MKALAIALTLLMAGPAVAAPIHLHNNPGGDVIGFLDDFRQTAAEGRKIVISGNCLSSCTIGLKFPNVCVMPNARLGFHAASNPPGFHLRRNSRGTAILQSAIPPELISQGKIKLPLTFKLQYVNASELPARYLCKVAPSGNVGKDAGVCTRGTNCAPPRVSDRT
jgi:hypothetical protein